MGAKVTRFRNGSIEGINGEKRSRFTYAMTEQRKDVNLKKKISLLF